MTGGTGQILELARRGDVDLTMTHDSAAEAALVAAGRVAERRPFMRSEFVVAGPPSDPAGVAGTRDPVAALRRIAAAGATFVSRGDDSGTHHRELALWSAAAREGDDAAAAIVDSARADPDWYVVAGVGMGDALRLASERRAYLLTEYTTFAVLRASLDLAPLVRGDARLDNVYATALVVGSPHADAAATFAEWLHGPTARATIADLRRDEAGRPLFEPTDAATSD